MALILSELLNGALQVKTPFFYLYYLNNIQMVQKTKRHTQ